MTCQSISFAVKKLLALSLENIFDDFGQKNGL